MIEDVADVDLEIAQQNLMILARLILNTPQAHMDAVLDELSRMDALMPIVDPTGYRNVMNNIPAHRRVYSAIATARREIQSALEEQR